MRRRSKSMTVRKSNKLKSRKPLVRKSPKKRVSNKRTPIFTKKTINKLAKFYFF
jgi:hypothetical protein